MTRTAAPRRRPRDASRKHRPVHRPSRPVHRPSRARAAEPLASYSDGASLRELVVLRGAGGSLLVVDRDAVSACDARLVAHLGADEPPENAALLARMYLCDGSARRVRCRALSACDLSEVAFVAPPCAADRALVHRALEGSDRELAQLELVDAGLSIPQLRWCMRTRRKTPSPSCSLRDVIGALESYEPACSITQLALAQRAADPAVSTATLASELRRVRNSPIVLNRALRERVLAALDSEGLSMSEIAIRCRRVKRDTRGNESGETSWLARRVGLLPDTGRCAPTPWVHSDVLALIAREGLGVSPREVELH